VNGPGPREVLTFTLSGVFQMIELRSAAGGSARVPIAWPPVVIRARDQRHLHGAATLPEKTRNFPFSPLQDLQRLRSWLVSSTTAANGEARTKEASFDPARREQSLFAWPQIPAGRERLEIRPGSQRL